MNLYYESSNELYHHGIKGMKWGRRRFQNSDGSLTAAGRKRYVTVRQATKNAKQVEKDAVKALNNSPKKHTLREYGNAARAASKQSVANDKAYNKQLREERKAERNTPEAKAARKEKAIKAAKVGAAVAGTALAAYGTYKVAQYVQSQRSQAAMQKANDYINKNAYQKIGETVFADGTVRMDFATGDGSAKGVFQGTRNTVGKAVGKHNAKVVAEGRQMYRDATNTRLDKGLSKVVNTGDAVGKAANTARENAGRAANTAKNRVLDVVNPIYEYTPGATRATTTNVGNGITMTKETTELIKKKVRR